MSDNNDFKKYRRSQIAELRKVEQIDIDEGISGIVSISQADLLNGSPKIGDMIARNPKNYEDQWLIGEQYFKDNFEEY